MDIKELRNRETELQDEYDATNRRLTDIKNELGMMGPRHPDAHQFEIEVSELAGRCNVLNGQLRELRGSIDAHERLYRRPNGRLTRLLSEMPGPLPKGMERYKFDDAAVKEMPRFHYRPLLALVGAIAIGYVMLRLLPKATPLALISELDKPLSQVDFPVWFSVILAVFILGLFLKAVLAHRTSVIIEHEIALKKVQWFISGAESWGLDRRILGCFGFGLYGFLSIMLPAAFIPASMFLGATVMAVYLRTYRRSNDVKWATLVAAHYHAVIRMWMNLFAWFLLVLVFIEGVTT